MNALTVNETLRISSLDELKTTNKNNSSIKEYFDAMFVFLIREFPVEDASDFFSRI